MSRKPPRPLAVTALRAALLMAVVRTFLSITLLLCLSGQALGQTLPTIAVKMVDLVDSSRDPAGKQYRAGLVRPVNIGNGVIIAQGSAATVTLVRNGSGWNVQLSSLVIKDHVTTVTSNAGTVIGAAAQSNVANAANAANSVLGSLGRKPNTYSPVAVVANGERVILTPGISLSFVLNAVPVVPAPSSTPTPVAQQPAATTAGQSAPAQAQKQQGGGWWWYCQAGQYVTGVFFYPTDITERPEVDSAIQAAWRNHAKREYPRYEDWGYAGCQLGGTDQASTQTIHDHMRAHQKDVIGKDVIDVDWKYVPGQDTPPPPSLAVSYCASDTNKPPIYFSDIFATNIPLSGGVTTTNIGNAFNQYLKEKYAYKTFSNFPVGCPVFRSTSDAEASKQALEAQWKRANTQIIETGWKWVLPPGTAVASASGKGNPSYCGGYGYNDNTEYFSDIFEMPPNTPLYPVIQDFARFVVEKYGLPHPIKSVTCPSSGNKDPDKQYGIKNGYKVIETGWKPKSLPPPNLGP
jgi:hypothetical protein